MKKLDDRKKGFEGKFVRDQDLEFKILARRNKYLGVWAAERLRITGGAVEDYCKEVIKADMEEAGQEDVFRKIKKDFQSASISIDEAEIRKEIEKALSRAKQDFK